MKRFTRRIYSALAVSALTVLAACSSEETTADAPAKIEINVAYGNQPGEPIDQLAHKWKELVEQRSEGRVSLKLYPSSLLGS